MANGAAVSAVSRAALLSRHMLLLLLLLLRLPPERACCTVFGAAAYVPPDMHESSTCAQQPAEAHCQQIAVDGPNTVHIVVMMQQRCNAQVPAALPAAAAVSKLSKLWLGPAFTFQHLAPAARTSCLTHMMQGAD